jgi:hypothetical protein
MSKKKPYKTPHDKNEQVNEPVAVFNKSKLTMFNSFEEMNEYDIKEMALFSPTQRFQHITELLKRMFAKELKKKMDLKIHFEKPGHGRTAS